jgi:hypothetical protein
MGTTAVEELLLDAMRRLHAEGRVLYHSDVAREAGVTPDCVAAYKARLARKGLLDPAWSFACPGGRRPASPRRAGGRRRRRACASRRASRSSTGRGGNVAPKC